MGKLLADESGPSYEAARHLIDFLDDLGKRTGYRPHGAKINEIREDAHHSGHSVSLPTPAKGFSEFQLECINRYSQGLAYWRDVSSELAELEKTVEVRFRFNLTKEDKQKLGFREKLRRLVMPRDHKLALLVAHVLAEKSFKVREPTEVVLITRDKTYRGYGLQVRYPFDRGKDLAGVSQAYDKILPMIADAFAREHKLCAEAVCQEDLTTIVFTRQKDYVSSLYDHVPQFRIALPRKKSILATDVAYFTRKSYRACKKLSAHYKNDFIMPKKPNPLWDETGYCMVMLYKKGAGGKLVDASYGNAVTTMAQQLAKKYHLRASIEVRPDIRSIVANFSDRVKA